MIEKLARIGAQSIDEWSTYGTPCLDDDGDLLVNVDHAFNASAFVRAVLQALMEPTPNMVEAGTDNVVGCCAPSRKEATEIWKSMIEAAMRSA